MSPCKFAFAVVAVVLGVVAGDAQVQKASAAEQSFLAPARWLGVDFTGARGWHKERHPRMLADLNGDKRQDLVGFGDDGVWIAFSTGAAFSSARFALANFGYNQAWRSEKHVRILADINNDGLEDIVAFGDDGVWTALSTGGGFAETRFVLANAGYNQGWRVDKHVRVLADVNSDGCADIVAFGDEGVWLSLADCSGGFGPFMFVIANFGANQAWDPLKHLRLVEDINGDGRADVVAFGDDGVWTALSTGSGFAEPHFVLANFGYNQGWRVRINPRQLADIDRDGKKDIIGFGTAGVWTARSTGDGGFDSAVYVFAQFGSNHWSGSPRMVIDLNADGYLDIVGIGLGVLGRDLVVKPMVWRSLGGPTGFTPPRAVLINFPDDAYASDNLTVGDVDNDGKPDLVIFDYQELAGPAFLGRYTAVARSTDLAPPALPAAPSNVQLTDPTPTTLTAAWQNNSSDTRFFALSYPGYGEALHSPRKLYGLTSDFQYCLKVFAISWFGVPTPSSEACARTTPQPTTPWVDLYAYTVDLSPTYFPKTGDTLTITWLECANGTQASGPYNVSVHHDGDAIYTVRRSGGLSIGCHNSESVTAQARAGTHTISVWVDTDNEVSEVSKANNTTTDEYSGD